MSDHITIDSLAHDYISDIDHRGEFLDAFDQDEFDHLARGLMQLCISDYNKLPTSVGTVVFKMAEVMAMKELDIDYDIATITPF